MEYIDKTISREWAHELIKAFLKRRLEEDGGYPEDLYSAFRGDPICKDQFVERLLADNKYRCCYCMRDIKGTTLEHMIPRSVKTQEDFNRYFELDSNLDNYNMKLASEFHETPDNVPPYPHTIAYENLIPSCFGNFSSKLAKCCNNYRKDNIIHPLIFRPNIHDEVKYKSNGNIVWTEDTEPIFPTLSKLGLDCLELKAIRRIWYYLANHGLDCEDTNKDEVIDNLLIELGVPKNSHDRNMQHMLSNFKNLDYWNILKKFSYFNDLEIFE